MPKRGPRNKYAIQVREAARIVSEAAYRHPWDPYRDSVNLLTSGDIAYHLLDRLGDFDPRVTSNYDVGEVLSDPYGRGTLQRPGAPIT